ncbi:unnamed protein product [Linum trigynum]|uniref:Uncharacterized protein n=1 Tax=Linum trigynum TaxID=586398 RepID=A0AAV2FDZ3_9ROSI
MISIEVREARRVGAGEAIGVARAGKRRSSEKGSMQTLERQCMSSPVACRAISSPQSPSPSPSLGIWRAPSPSPLTIAAARIFFFSYYCVVGR